MSSPAATPSPIFSVTSLFSSPATSIRSREQNKPFAPLPPSIYLASSPGRQIGLYAAQALQRGDEILCEAPLFTLSSPTFLLDDVSKLPPDRRSAFFALSNAYSTSSTMSDEEGIFHTNAFSLSSQTRISTAPSSSSLYGIFPTVARLNHSCLPNVKTSYHPASRTMRVHVLRPISPHDELFTSYLGRADLYGSYTGSRQARLGKSWRFTCSCELCSLSAETQEASNIRRRELSQLRSSLPGLRPRDVEQSVRACARALELLDEEGLHLDGDDFAFAAAKACAWHQDWAATRLWAQVGWESAKDEYGRESELAMALEKAVKRPQEVLPVGAKGEKRSLERLSRKLLGKRVDSSPSSPSLLPSLPLLPGRGLRRLFGLS